MFKLLRRPVTTDPPSPMTPRLHDLHEYWNGLHAEGMLPGRQHIFPADIPALLPDIMMLDYANGQYRCRLAGTGVVENLGRELTGQAIDRDLLGPAFAPWLHRLEVVRHRAQPLNGSETLWWQDRPHRLFHWLCLPLATNGRDVDKLLLCLDWA